MTIQTQARNDNLRTLIAELRHYELTQEEIADLFKCSRSGVRVYLKCLGALVETINQGSIILPRTYRLTSDQAAIDAFLASIEETKPRQSKGSKPRSRVDALRRDPTRHVHIMADDAPFRVPVCHVRPQHPAIHLAFWGAVA